ncbi:MULTISPECIES: ROK family transcriptional regulator [Clostridium]|uniref:N-acetylglucosamine repressor n=2 Tax=Clostridium TaxID=1485 RepID=A0A151AKJ4_9CLOT|nr:MULTISPECIES: ROK family transcriptional regulator [Clostridium]KYH28166.1 N-acetylglucosamine repressor [Clostridium colicanis DSM 13634]MBE6044244.1 ROK family transcriptional regulator [Clostridium thermopalmarium]PRR70567.1 N-acetylglucosamine repressor [Clostridium thermopalmarium DSM 5974]PVZ21703.1 putative NBD/HSP70 family sugar kinase [Clostridium thermopalmarium DSM 5974]
MGTLGHSDIKINNKKRIIKLLSKERELTKLDISRMLDISVTTVTTIVGELKEEGIVEEAGMATSTGGRKPVIIRFLPDSRYSIGVDLGRDYIRAVLVNLDGKIIEDRTMELLEINNLEVLSIMKRLIQELLDTSEDVHKKLLGIGFSLPGIINEKEFRLELATNFRLKDISFKEIQEEFNLPIYLENEANAGALAECKLGIAKDLSNLIYISITEGVGGGIIINNDMYKGRNNKAGEIGHMTIIKGGRTCNCGKKGCWETYASNRALIRDYNEKSKENVNKISDIIKKFEIGEEKAVQVVEDYTDYLVEGIQNLVFIFNPDYIVIGGEISNYSSIFSDKLKAKTFNKNEFYNKENVNILFSLLGNDSNILGAALIPIIDTFGV